MEVDDTVRVKVEVEDEDGLEWKPNTELDLDKEIEGCSGRKGEEEEGSEEGIFEDGRNLLLSFAFFL